MTAKHDDSCRRVEFPCCDDQMCPCDLVEFDRLQAENARLREALGKLSNESSGLIHAHEFALSMDGGNSNMQALRIRLEEARAVLEGKE